MNINDSITINKKNDIVKSIKNAFYNSILLCLYEFIDIFYFFTTKLIQKAVACPAY